MTAGYGRFVVPGLSTLVMMVVLIGLGTWQVQRLHWKQTILEQIAKAEAAPAVPLMDAPAPYTKVSVTGRFQFDRAAQFGVEVRDTRAGPTIGFDQIVPLDRDGAPPLLVDRGWVPLKRQTPLDDPAGAVTIVGYVRPGEKPSWFSASDDVPARQFFTLDPRAIGNAVGVRDPEPFTLVALGQATAEVYPAPTQHLPRPLNNHLSYVITWYGLAGALAVISGAWMRKALRS
ncbi:MAG TPA: SURF1 family protein [Rhodopila sp.]